jgi:hypothetical protein
MAQSTLALDNTLTMAQNTLDLDKTLTMAQSTLALDKTLTMRMRNIKVVFLYFHVMHLKNAHKS